MEWKEIQIRIGAVCLLFVLLSLFCLLPISSQDADQQVQWYLVSSQELEELTKLYSLSGSRQNQALQKQKQLQNLSVTLKRQLDQSLEDCRIWKQSYATEAEKVNSLERSFIEYKAGVQIQTNAQAAEIVKLQTEKNDFKTKIIKLKNAIAVLAAILVFILLLIGVCIFLKIKGLFRLKLRS